MYLQRLALLGTSVLLAGIQTAYAQDDSTDARDAQRCVTLQRIDRTEIIDDRTVIFHMRNNVILMNHLTRSCPGLKREDRFLYSTLGNRLCSVDTITVLELAGFGLSRGFTCGLGKFVPISKTELDLLKQDPSDVDDAGFKIVPVKPRPTDASAETKSSSGDTGKNAAADPADATDKDE